MKKSVNKLVNNSIEWILDTDWWMFIHEIYWLRKVVVELWEHTNIPGKIILIPPFTIIIAFVISILWVVITGLTIVFCIPVCIVLLVIYFIQKLFFKSTP